MTTTILPATPADVPLILAFVRELAEFERLADQVVATEALLHDSLFGPRAVASAVIARVDGEPAGFALWFYSYSTFLARPGLYLEDLYVRPAHRSRGLGQTLIRTLAAIAVERGCGRMEWAVLNWNERAIRFYESLGALPQNQWTVYRLTGPTLAAVAAASAAPPAAN